MARLEDKFNEALAYAATLHREQSRNGTEIPYVSHLLATASIVLEHGGSEDEAIGALLHDAGEDCGPEEVGRIKAKFGEDVARIVEGCTDSFRRSEETWRVIKLRYVDELTKKPSATRLVSAADKLHNARAILADYRRIGEGIWERFGSGREQLWYYPALVRAFLAAGDHTDLVDELAQVVRELEWEAGIAAFPALANLQENAGRLLEGARLVQPALNVGDVNVEGRAIAVRSGKGDKDRTVMVPLNVQPMLRVLTEGRQHDEPLFIGKNIRGECKRLAPDAISYIFTRKVSPAMGRPVTAHMCRHSYATMLVNRGTALNQIQQLMGHASLATTQIYLHASGRELRSAVEVLDEIA